jgi:hypothetical protein
LISSPITESNSNDINNTVSKLYILKNSCAGVLNSEKSNPNSLWFQGAEVMLSETVNDLQQALHTIESGEEEKSAVSEDVEEEAPVDETASEEEESPE